MIIPPVALELAGRLRAATKSAHHDLDHHPLLAPLVTKNITVQQYSNALRGLYGPQQAIETWIQPSLAMLGQFSSFPPRAEYLLADLALLGVQPFEAQFTSTFVHTDIARMLGYWYVLEGSNLGSAVIAKQIAKTLPEVPMSFFKSAQGSAAGAVRMQRFWLVVAAHDQAQHRDDTIAAALQAFQIYKSHLDACTISLPPDLL